MAIESRTIAKFAVFGGVLAAALYFGLPMVGIGPPACDTGKILDEIGHYVQTLPSYRGGEVRITHIRTVSADASQAACLAELSVTAPSSLTYPDIRYTVKAIPGGHRQIADFQLY